MTIQNIEMTGTEPRIRVPWRRFWARMLDFALYGVLLQVVLNLILGVYFVESAGMMLVMLGLQTLLMLLLEPLLLHLWGTTPGKWILGLSITDEDGGRLSLADAWDRTWGVLFRGCGLGVPLVSQVCYLYWLAQEGKEQGLPWEEHNLLVVRDRRPRRFAAAAVCFGLLVLANTHCALSREVPPNRGDLTVAAFAENFNELAHRLDLGDGNLLTEEGQWPDQADNPLAAWNQERPDYTYVLENGRINGLCFQVKLEGEELLHGAYANEKALPLMALVRAQGPGWPWSRETRLILQAILERPFDDWTLEAYGCTVENRVTLDHYQQAVDGILFEQEGEIGRFTLDFSITLP